MTLYINKGQRTYFFENLAMEAGKVYELTEKQFDLIKCFGDVEEIKVSNVIKEVEEVEKESEELKEAKAKAKELGIDFPKNISLKTLLKKIEEKNNN